VLVVRVLAAVTVALATVVVTTAQLNLPSKEFWQNAVAVRAQWAGVGVLAVFVVVTELRQIGQLAGAARVRTYDLDLWAALSQVLCAVVERTEARWDEVEVSFYRRRPGLLPWRPLVRVASLRLGAASAHAAPSWPSGVGVVGAAYASGEALMVNWERFRHEAVQEGKTAWDKRETSQRYGMNWGQLVSGGARDRWVLAAPTFHRGSGGAMGCVLLSGGLKADNMTVEGLRPVLEDLATALDRLGPPPRGWWAFHDR
jgi:hypothetical protein